MNTADKRMKNGSWLSGCFCRPGRPLVLLVLLGVILAFLPGKAAAAEHQVKAPKMACHSYVVMDAGTGEVLFGQDEDKQIYPASTAKLMTAIVCVEQGNVDSKIKTKREVLDSTPYGTFCLGLSSGVRFRFRDLLGLSLVSSAADATNSLAAGVFGSVDGCVAAMNEKCSQMGLSHTSFDNPVGSDIGAGYNHTWSTAREMALITRYANAIPLIRELAMKSHYETSVGQEIDANSTNWFLRGIVSYNRDRYHIIGTKSGTTNAAGHVFIATAVDNDGHEVICAYFGNVSKESTFAGIRKLFNYTFKKVDQGKLTLSGKCDDVRASSLSALFDTYAPLHVYPTGADGRFHPNAPINRSQLARLLKGVDKAEGAVTLPAEANLFARGNQKGMVTAARAARLIQDIYPAHLPDDEVEEILKDCANTEELEAEEKEAFALFVKTGLLPDPSCRNARQVLTRKQALILADHLADYQLDYAASYPVGPLVFSPDGETGTMKTPLPVILMNYKWKK